MKKLYSALVIFGFLAVLIVPQLTLAVVTAVPQNCTLKRDLTGINPACANGASVSIEDYGMCCLLNTLYNVTDWIFVVLVALAGLFVIIGAMTILMAAGSPEKVTAGRNYIMYAAIGLIVGLLARAVPNLVRMISGM